VQLGLLRLGRRLQAFRESWFFARHFFNLSGMTTLRSTPDRRAHLIAEGVDRSLAGDGVAFLATHFRRPGQDQRALVRVLAETA
jgi:hypothetical protein